MKKERQSKILNLIENQPIETQEELQQCLFDAGYDVTQATVSRDIKELRIVKMLDANGIYRYAVNGGSSPKSIKYIDMFAHSAVSVVYSMNDVVIKCHPGMAQGACASLDMMKCENVLGTLAGDDTIFVITKTEKDAAALADMLSEIIKQG
ncbi:MAG: ArgR family transcriptional regulator [Clostridia bacterium]|nr:ArgR family transcriptional regulator [Clostridia bacterium]MBO5913345.1 ArgR family transcriptional regulator [Clostridia bacterium]